MLASDLCSTGIRTLLLLLLGPATGCRLIERLKDEEAEGGRTTQDSSWRQQQSRRLRIYVGRLDRCWGEKSEGCVCKGVVLRGYVL
jgi:hypothetical protein